MRPSVAANAFKMHGVLHGARAHAIRRVTGFVSAFEYLESFAAKLQHLRHEWEFSQPSVLIESGKDFFFTFYFQPLPGLPLLICHTVLPGKATLAGRSPIWF